MTRCRVPHAVALFTATLMAVGPTSAYPRAQQDQPESPREAVTGDLAPTGQIRACSTAVNPALNTRDPTTGQLRGVSVDVTRELGTPLGVEAVLTGYASDAVRDRALVEGECDLIFTAVTTTALEIVDLTAPLLVVDYTLLVPESSSIQSMADVDRPGVRVSAFGGAPPERVLSQQMQYAELIPTASPEEAFGLLVAGEVEALASNRANAMSFADRLAGSRVLEDRFGFSLLALGLPKGRDAEIPPHFLTYSILGRYADIRRRLRSPLGPGLIGDIDTLIAAAAMERNLTVVTADSDLEPVAGLKVRVMPRQELASR